MRRFTDMGPASEDLFNERGEPGKADGLFCVEGGLYKAVLIAERRWVTPTGRKRRAKQFGKFVGWTARGLAKNMRAAGWEPPRGLRRLCEASRR